MMNAQELRLKFEIDLAELQEKCKHEQVETMQYSYAPGHFGAMVKVCLNCDKVLDETETT